MRLTLAQEVIQKQIIADIIAAEIDIIASYTDSHFDAIAVVGKLKFTVISCPFQELHHL